jgi:hypothetical protein
MLPSHHLQSKESLSGEGAQIVRERAFVEGICDEARDQSGHVFASSIPLILRGSPIVTISEIASLSEVSEPFLYALVQVYPEDMPHPDDLESWSDFVYRHKGQQAQIPLRVQRCTGVQLFTVHWR